MVQILSFEKEKKIEKIFHISDIHIRLYRRKEEYLYCFQELYKKIRSYPKGENLILITGDILHNKLEMSPECETMTFDFLDTLSSIYPTLFILGNHDTLLNNRDRLDSLSSILYKRQIHNLYYLKYTDIYQYHNILFYVDSLLDEKEIDMVNILNDNINIGLYHGGIRGWKNSKGYVSDSGEKYIEDFLGMDYVLLGDIHLYQYMSKEKPVMAYPGSLISQNFGETDPNHGILVWNLEDKTQKFIKIENPYRYQDVYILSRERLKTDGYEYDMDKVPIASKGNIKLFGMENELESKFILQRLQKEWKEVTFSFQTYQENKQREEKFEVKDTEEEMIEYYLKEKIDKEYYNDIRNDIMKIWRERNQYYSSMQWSILSISFSNLFGYGEGNKISFPTYQNNNIIGIFGSNSVGKSTIIDIISLLLFDKLTRFPHGQSIPKEVIHFQEQEGNGCIELQIGGDLYRIEKKYKRLSSGKIKQQTNFYCIKEGISIELTEEQRNKTNQIIRDIIGSPDIFIYIHSFLQQREQSFRELTSSNKKKFLNELNGYSWFEKIEKEKKDILKELETKEKILSSMVLSPFHNKDKIIELEKIEEKNNKYKKKIKELEIIINSMYESLYTLKDELFLEQEEKKISNTILSLKKKKEEHNLFLKKWENYIDIFNNELNQDILNEWYEKRTKEEWEIFKKEIESLSSIPIKEKLEELYRKYSNEEININHSILSFYPRNKKKIILKDYSILNTISFEIELKKKYNQLYHSFEDIGNNEFYKEKEKNIYQKWKEYEKTSISLEEYYSIYQKYKDFIKEENITEFIERGLSYQDDFFYQSYSIFYKNKEEKFNHFLERMNSLNSSDIRNKISSLEKEMKEIEIPYLKKKPILKQIQYEQYKNDLEKEPYQCKDCSFILTNEFLNSLKELEEIETDKYVLLSELEVLENNIKECNFIPNPNCNVCIKNPNYIIKKRSEKKYIEKKKELKEKEVKEKEILSILRKKMRGVKDVHCKNIEYTLDFFYKVKEEKDICQKKRRDEEEEYHRKKEMMEDYEIHKKKMELEKKKNQMEEILKKYKKDLDFLLSTYEKRNIIEHIKKEWKQKLILPSSFSELETIFYHFKENFNEEEYKKIEIKKKEYKEKWNEFKEIWDKDILYKKEIQELEEQYLKRKEYKDWIDEVLKIEKKESMEYIKNEIQYYKEKENLYNDWEKNKELYNSIDLLWQEESSISNIKEKFQEIKKESLDIELVPLERDYDILKKELEENRKYKKLNTEKEEKIKELKIEKEIIIKEKEKEEERMIELKLEIKSCEEKKKENEERIKEIMSLKKEIEKEKILLKLMDKDGLPLYLLMKKMEPMEKQMNELISPFLPDKKIRFYIDQKTIEFGTFQSDNKNLCNYFGGMESFIIDLSLKLTFAKYGNLPRSNFFIIDEGISVLDSERIYNISFLFNFLSNITSNVLLISHIPQIRDFVDKEMIIEKKNDKSFIHYQ